MKLTVIVPTLNEAEEIAGCLAHLRREHEGETLVVDGGSTDDTIARAAGATILRSPRGLARQCNLAARAAEGDVLFFVAADSRPDPGWRDAIHRALVSPYVVAGGFRLRLDDPARAFRVIEWGGNFRSRYLGITLPDQGLFVKRATFEAVGGMKEDSLIPHARLCFDLKREGEVLILPLAMRSSARKWRAHGKFRTSLSHALTYLEFKRRELGR